MTMAWRRKHRKYLMSLSPFCYYCGVGLITWRSNSEPMPKYHKRVAGGVMFGYATLDHLTPISCGGMDTDANTVLACSACNFQKGGMPYEQFIAKKRRTNHDLRIYGAKTSCA